MAWQSAGMISWEQFTRTLTWPNLSGLLEIAVLTLALYYIFLFFRGTRGAQVFLGLVILGIGLMVVTQVGHLTALNWLLQHLSVYAVIAVVVIFQPEIRRALAELGRKPGFSGSVQDLDVLEELIKAVKELSAGKTGALIAIEREIGTRAIQESGTRLDAEVSSELLCTIFFPHTALHDGGVIVSGNRVRAAACVFPLTSKPLPGNLGTRHRAAVGFSEETDALVLVVSEETGAISVAYKGHLAYGVDESRLHRLLSALLVRNARKKESGWTRFRKTLDLSPSAIARTEAAMEKEFEDSEKTV
jgi:diadenylate cyclase